jgi:hypothetical protein
MNFMQFLHVTKHLSFFAQSFKNVRTIVNFLTILKQEGGWFGPPAIVG